MKRNILIFILVLITALANAQTVSKLKGQRRDIYDLPSSSWVHNDSTLYFYDGHANDTAIRNFYYGQNTWWSSSKYVKTYDQNDRNISLAIANLDTATGQAQNFYIQELISYDAAGDTSNILVQEWDTTTNNWRNYYRFYYYKDALGRDTGALIQIFSAGLWKNTQYVSTTFNSSGKVQLVTIGGWNSSNQYGNSQRSRYTYDSNGDLAYRVRQNWDASTSAWISQNRYNYTWAGGDITVREYQLYDDVSMTWTNDSLITMTYDGSHHPTLYVSQKYNTNTSAYENREQVTSGYDANYNLTDKVRKNWVSGQWKNSRHDTYQYNSNNQIIYDYYEVTGSLSTVYDPQVRSYYYYADISTGILDLPSAGPAAIYPNPVSGTAHVAFESEVGGDVTITATDMQGRTVITARYEASAGHNDIPLDISSISTGIYSVSVSTADGRKYDSVKLVKE